MEVVLLKFKLFYYSKLEEYASGLLLSELLDGNQIGTLLCLILLRQWSIVMRILFWYLVMKWMLKRVPQEYSSSFVR